METNPPTSKHNYICRSMICAAKPGCARHAIGSSRTTMWKLSTMPCVLRPRERKKALLEHGARLLGASLRLA